MERKLATIEKIIDIQPIEGADFIERATVRGWNCVVKKGEFNIGDYCVYCEIDSFLPVKPEFEFLRKSCYRNVEGLGEGFRIKTIKLKGTFSQGIVLPFALLPNEVILSTKYEDLIGMDVSEILGILKYEPPVPSNLGGKRKGLLPPFIRKTDEERIQNHAWILEKYKDIKFYVAEKLDGSSATFYLNENIFGVCSRGLDLHETDDNSFWKVARQLNIEEKLRGLNRNISIQGELIGEGIQKNKYKLKGQTVRFFNAFDIDKQKFFDYEDFVQLIASIGLETVPIISTDFILPSTIDEILKYANNVSVLNKDQIREGVVIRPLIEIFDSNMPHMGRLSFKVISNDFLVKYEE